MILIIIGLMGLILQSIMLYLFNSFMQKTLEHNETMRILERRKNKLLEQQTYGKESMDSEIGKCD